MIIYAPLILPIFELSELKKGCERLRRRDSHKMGFIPINAYRDAIIRNRILICTEEDKTGLAKGGSCGDNKYTIEKKFSQYDLIGLIYWGVVGETCTIYQIVVSEDHRRQKIGSNMIEKMMLHESNQKTKLVKLRCRIDIVAGNLFWKSLGFEIIDTVDEENKKKIDINYYEREVDGIPDPL